jgi:hypothetical protein
MTALISINSFSSYPHLQSAYAGMLLPFGLQNGVVTSEFDHFSWGQA